MGAWHGMGHEGMQVDILCYHGTYEFYHVSWLIMRSIMGHGHVYIMGHGKCTMGHGARSVVVHHSDVAMAMAMAMAVWYVHMSMA